MTLKETKVILQPKKFDIKKGKLVLLDNRNFDRVFDLIKKYTRKDYLNYDKMTDDEHKTINIFLNNNHLVFNFPSVIIKILTAIKNNDINIDVIEYSETKYEILSKNLYGIVVWNGLVELNV